MLVWVPDEHLEFAIFDGMRGVQLPPPEPRSGKGGGGRAIARLSEEQRRVLAKSVMEQFRRCRWRVVRPEVRAHGTPNFKWKG